VGQAEGLAVLKAQTRVTPTRWQLAWLLCARKQAKRRGPAEASCGGDDAVCGAAVEKMVSSNGRASGHVKPLVVLGL